jgi:hypothetical protein
MNNVNVAYDNYILHTFWSLGSVLVLLIEASLWGLLTS